MVPDTKPRTECGCQPVAFMSCLAVTPPGRLSRSRILVVLLPLRGPVAFFAPLGAFLTEVALFAAFAFFGAPWARCGRTLAFFGALDFSPVAGTWSLPFSSAIGLFMFSPWR